MSEWTFIGFPSRAEVTPVPSLFFTQVLPRISSINELKAVLYIFWLLSRRRGYPQFVTLGELLAAPVFVEGIDPVNEAKQDVIYQALQQAVTHQIILKVEANRGGQFEAAYLINNDAGREALAKIRRGNFTHLSSAPQSPDKKASIPDIYSLYEQNIGILTPLIAEQLQEAETLYPQEWIESAFKEAVALNKRSWKYVLRILERWAIEGKDDGKLRRDTEKGRDREKYVKGKYGHMVKG